MFYSPYNTFPQNVWPCLDTFKNKHDILGFRVTQQQVVIERLINHWPKSPAIMNALSLAWSHEVDCQDSHTGFHIVEMRMLFKLDCIRVSLTEFKKELYVTENLTWRERSELNILLNKEYHKVFLSHKD